MTARYAAPRVVGARRLAVGASAAVLAASGLGAAGALPLPSPPAEVALESALTQPVPPEASSAPEPAGTGLSGAERQASEPASEPAAVAAAELAAPVEEPAAGVPPGGDPTVKPAATASLPPGSGSGRRVVYDISDQQVWLVDDAETVVRTYPVSGSRFDQVEPGTYEVYSTSRHAVGWHGTETMEHMVRFTRGERAAIGFHSIPVSSETGDPLQTLSQLGAPLSDGCIRQDPEDAAALYDFAPVGTTVVVTR